MIHVKIPVMYIKINYLKYLQNIKRKANILLKYGNIYNIEMINYLYTALLINYKLLKCTKSNISNPQKIKIKYLLFKTREQ